MRSRLQVARGRGTMGAMSEPGDGARPEGPGAGPRPVGLVFEPGRPATPPKAAATVIVLREAPAGLEVFCVVRNPRSGFLGGAVVFPGGKVDADDGDAGFAEGGEAAIDPRVAAVAGPDASASALLVAAARESLEEAGLVPTSAPPASVEAVRAALDRKEPFLASLRAHGVRLELQRLVPFARWVTPEAEPRRFDARFFLMAHPAGQVARPCQTETTQGFWATAAELLARFEAGAVQLAPPTTRCLELLAPIRELGEAFALAARQSLEPICPTFVPGDPPCLALPGDPAHAVPVARVAGPTRFVLRDGRFVSEDPPSG